MVDEFYNIAYKKNQVQVLKYDLINKEIKLNDLNIVLRKQDNKWENTKKQENYLQNQRQNIHSKNQQKRNCKNKNQKPKKGKIHNKNEIRKTNQHKHNTNQKIVHHQSPII